MAGDNDWVMESFKMGPDGIDAVKDNDTIVWYYYTAGGIIPGKMFKAMMNHRIDAHNVWWKVENADMRGVA